MKTITKTLIIMLIFICCIGAASATDDINNDTFTADNDLSVVEQIDDADTSEDTTLKAKNDENNILTENPVTVTTWNELSSNAGASGAGKTIQLSDGYTYNPTSTITFGNSATIIGTPDSYISGSYSGIPFRNTNSALSITFKNVNFKDISCTMLMQMAGTTVIDGCTFTNVNAASSGQNSVIYNTYGTMNITDSTFTNCKGSYGVITNYRWGTTTAIILNVKNSKFENNYAYNEPGCINNCGILTVYNTTFVGNNAELWGGAIHTHTNANTLINKSTFKSNTAGWGGGALFTYSVLRVYNSCFDDNNCTGDYGGAIGAYNYGSQFDIIVDNCTFKKNNNLNSNGKGGAIGTLNGGYLNVYDSYFIDNYAHNGLAIYAANQYIENGTDDRAYLEIEGCTFENHTGTSDTVVISGYINAFNDNTFINSPQSNHYSGSGNTYNSIYLPILLMNNNDDVLSIFNENILEVGSASTIYVNVSSSNPVTGRKASTTTGEGWDTAYGTDQGLKFAIQYINNNGKIIVAGGNYTTLPDYEQTVLNRYLIGYTIEGFDNDVVFSFEGLYNLDAGSREHYGDMSDGNYAINSIITHKNIIFDCDVKVGSKNFKFVDCTFNKGVEISRDYVSDDICNITFENCIFANPKSDIVVADKNNVDYNECTFPINAVNTNVAIVSNEKGIIIINLTDVDGNAIEGATVKYTINNGEELSSITDSNGQFKIYGLTGLVNIFANFTGNESYNANTSSASFDFKLNSNIVITNESKVIVITLTDENGKTINGASVTYTINNGEELSNITNSNGQIKITQLPDEFEIKVNYIGNDTFNGNNTSEKFNFTKPTVNPPADNATNTSGSQTPAKTNPTNTATKTKKVASKITAKKATFKAKKKTKKYTIVLKAGKKAIKKVKVTLKVGKKTYKATTNSKGKATFKITKLNKKGKYTAVIKFAGNKNYKATSKKVKIKVKK